MVSFSLAYDVAGNAMSVPTIASVLASVLLAGRLRDEWGLQDLDLGVIGLSSVGDSASPN